MLWGRGWSHISFVITPFVAIVNNFFKLFSKNVLWEVCICCHCFRWKSQLLLLVQYLLPLSFYRFMKQATYLLSPESAIVPLKDWSEGEEEKLTNDSSIEENQPITCVPQKYVLFLKTHKTGSSTITNILNRYADQYNMTILLPKGSGYYSFDWPNKFRLSFAAETFTRPNFLANHARYSRKSMNVLFPRDSAMYISVLRHPVSQWESTFQYMSLPYILDISHKEDPLNFFLNNLPSTENIIEISRRYPSLYLIRNPLFFDLGLDYKYYKNATFIRQALKILDNDFDLMLIMEHFDESLTLLRRRLCWNIDDVVYFKMNERLNKHKRRVLSELQIQKIKSWNNADVVLYNYFVEKFWREVKNEGPGFYDDVEELRRRRKHYSKICIEKEAVEEAYSSVFVKGYKMRSNLTHDTRVFCERMLKNELHYMDYFRMNRARFINKIEGVNIQNFEIPIGEVDMYVETSDIRISAYKYGRPKPTKKIRAERTPKNISHVAYKTRTKQAPTQTKPGQSQYGQIVNNNSQGVVGKFKRLEKTQKPNNPVVIDELSTIPGSVVDDTSKDELKYDGKTIMNTSATNFGYL